MEKKKKEYTEETSRTNKNRDDARTAREIEWERVPFEDCETDYQFNLTPIAHNSKKWDHARAFGLLREHEEESSEEYLGSTGEGWHICGIRENLPNMGGERLRFC